MHVALIPPESERCNIVGQCIHPDVHFLFRVTWHRNTPLNRFSWAGKTDIFQTALYKSKYVFLPESRDYLYFVVFDK